MTRSVVSLQRKLMTIILLVSGVVSLMTCAALFGYEYLTFRQNTVRHLATVGEMIATSSTAALAFDNQDDARDILAALKAERHVTSAALYDHAGRLFATYPAGAPAGALPSGPQLDGYRFEDASLVAFQPVEEGGNRLGTLYLRSDLAAIDERFRSYGAIVAAVIAASFGVAYLLSRALQKQVSQPILALAATAQAISARADYSMRAAKLGNDEVGQLTDSFNQMVARVQELNRDLEARVRERTAQLEAANGELRRSRTQLRNFFEALPGLFLILTPDLRIVTASDAYLKATMTTREGIGGRDLFEVFPDNPNDAAATGASNLRASLDRVRQNAAPDTMAIQKYDVRRPDGTFEEHYWSPVNAPVLNADRQVEFIIHRVEEVTEFVRHKSQAPGDAAGLRARMETMEAEIFQSSQQVQAANRQLELANKELEAFSYSVSHDLRAPLRHIDGFAQLLGRHLEQVLDDTGRRYLATVTSSAKRLGVLIDELLVFSRMGRREMRRAGVDSRALIDEAVRELQPETQGRQIDWAIGGLPPVQGDPVMLRQVWSNLLGNALKYSRKREVARIEILHRLDAADGHVFSVRDNGAGFQMEYAAKLFGVFQRLHNASEFEGTGIGLANVRRIVERHGGRVWAEGRPNEGATFYFSLPAGTAAPGKPEPPPP